jgi:hypothetical protein
MYTSTEMGIFKKMAVMLILGFGLKAKLFGLDLESQVLGLGLASSGLGIDATGLVNI